MRTKIKKMQNIKTKSAFMPAINCITLVIRMLLKRIECCELNIQLKIHKIHNILELVFLEMVKHERRLTIRLPTKMNSRANI